MTKFNNSVLEADVAWKDSILGKASGLIFGSIGKGWKKTNLRFLAREWAAEYYKAIKEVRSNKEDDNDLSDTSDNDVLDTDEDVLQSTNNINDKISIKIELLNFFISLNTSINLILKSKNGTLSNSELTELVSNLNYYAKNRKRISELDTEFKDNPKFLEFNRRMTIFSDRRSAITAYLKNVEVNDAIELSAILKALTDELSDQITDLKSKADTVINNLEDNVKAEEEEQTKNPDKSSNEYEEKLHKIEEQKAEIEKLHKKIELLTNLINKLEDEKRHTEQPTVSATIDHTTKPATTAPTTTLAPPLFIPMEDTRTPGQKGLDKIKANREAKKNALFNNSFNKTFNKNESLLNRYDIIGERFVLQDVLDKLTINLKGLKVNDNEKELITSKVNIKALAVIQAKAEGIYMIFDKADRYNPNDKDKDLESFWKRLILMVDNKFQNFVNVEKVNDLVVKKTLTADQKNILREENTIIKNADKAGITEALSSYKLIKQNQLVVMGFKRNSGSGYMLLQKLKEQNWYILYTVMNSAVETQSEALGKTVARIFKTSNSMLVYLDFYKPTSCYMFMYNSKNGLIYNKTADGIKFSELEPNLTFLKNKQDFYTMTADELKPDVNRRTISNVLVIGNITPASAEKIYGVDTKNMSSFVNKHASAIRVAEEQHNDLMSYVQKLPE